MPRRADRNQVAVAIETVPGTAASLAGTDVLDILERPTFSLTQEFIERTPTGGSLSRSVEAPGVNEAEAGCVVDLKGTGTATTAPRFGRLFEAAMFESFAITGLNCASTTEDLCPGDQLTGATSGATAVVLGFVAESGSSSQVPIYVKSGSFQNSENINSALKGASVGALTGSATSANVGVGYKPISTSRVSLSLTGAWSAADPGSGKGIVIEDGADVVATGFFVSMDSTTLTMDLAWGSIAAGNTLTSLSSAGATVTATVDSPSDLVQVTGKTVTYQEWIDNRIRTMTGARATFQLTCDAGSAGRIEFTVRGGPQAPSEGPKLTASGLPTTTSPRFIGPNGLRGSVMIDGIPIPTKSATVAAGVEMAQRLDANAVNGVAGYDATGRNPTITLDVEAGPLAEFNSHTKLTTSATSRIGIQWGATTGNRIVIAAEAAQLTRPSDGDADGLVTESLEFALRKAADAGDDELYIAFT